MSKNKFRQQSQFQQEFNTLSFSFENSPDCLATTKTEIGPYYLGNVPKRIDIRENQDGVGLLLGLKIVNWENCEKLQNAKVELWQANASGKYSGFNQNKNKIALNSELWLRGYQETDSLGFVEFKTIYPGKYHNRTNHIHLKISYLEQVKLTTELFFPQNINDYIATIYPYNQYHSNITNFNDPIILKHYGCMGCWLKVSPFGNRFIGTLTIGIKV